MSISNTIIDKHAAHLATKRNVVGVAIGQKWTNGVNTGIDAILVFVEKKEPLNTLRLDDKIPPAIDGVPTDVVGKTGKFVKLGYTSKERPICPGISVGHPNVTAGTIGGIFKDRENSVVILSNNHILAAENKAKRGDAIIQPGRYDGGTIADKIATLKYYRPLVKKGQMTFDAVHWKEIWGYNVEDSAAAPIADIASASPIIKELGTVAGWNDNPTVGTTVLKTGRTTGKTTGKIIATSATVFVSYDVGTLEFRDQIITTNMSDGGDSGSLLVDQSNNAVGLLYAGSNTTTIHNPIKYPRATYGLEIWQPVALNEHAIITVIEDGNTIVQTLQVADIPTAVLTAKSAAINSGKATTILLEYNVERQS